MASISQGKLQSGGIRKSLIPAFAHFFVQLDFTRHEPQVPQYRRKNLRLYPFQDFAHLENKIKSKLRVFIASNFCVYWF